MAIQAKKVTVRGQEITIYCYELFILLLQQWKAQGLSREEIEELLLS